jgi:hypothetical protein
VSDDGSGGLCADAPGTPLNAAGSVSVGPDGGSVYTAASVGGLAVFDRATGGQITALRPSFAFSANQAGASFECSLDGGTFATCSSPTTTPELSDGAHSIAVRAATGGDVDRTPARRAFRVDTTGQPVRRTFRVVKQKRK